MVFVGADASKAQQATLGEARLDDGGPSAYLWGLTIKRHDRRLLVVSACVMRSSTPAVGTNSQSPNLHTAHLQNALGHSGTCQAILKYISDPSSRQLWPSRESNPH